MALEDATLANISFSTTKIKLKHGTAAEWTATNPVLEAGEPGYISDSNILKVGDGTTAFNSLTIPSKPIHIVDLTASMVSSTSLAANGADLASGTNHTFYSVFMAPVACTIVSMDVLITEDYVKETTDAKIELITEEETPVTKCTTTLDEDGVTAKTIINVTPTDAELAAGDILNLAITESASTSGTGHAKVFMRYTIN